MMMKTFGLRKLRKQTKKMWTETCEETVDRKKAQHKDLVSGDT